MITKLIIAAACIVVSSALFCGCFDSKEETPLGANPKPLSVNPFVTTNEPVIVILQPL